MEPGTVLLKKLIVVVYEGREWTLFGGSVLKISPEEWLAATSPKEQRPEDQAKAATE